MEQNPLVNQYYRVTAKDANNDKIGFIYSNRYMDHSSLITLKAGSMYTNRYRYSWNDIEEVKL